MKHLYKIFILLCFACIPSMAMDMSKDSVDLLKMQADSAYANEDFENAERIYLQLAEQGESAVICYNLGCTYYRQDNIAKAVLWYERAAQLDPSDDDIRFNLAMARGKTIDRIIPRHEMFFVSAWKTLMHSQSVTEWAYWAIGAFVMFLLLVALYIYCYAVYLR